LRNIDEALVRPGEYNVTLRTGKQVLTKKLRLLVNPTIEEGGRGCNASATAIFPFGHTVLPGALFTLLPATLSTTSPSG
jgi:hypothetical protein